MTHQPTDPLPPLPPAVAAEWGDGDNILVGDTPDDELFGLGGDILIKPRRV